MVGVQGERALSEVIGFLMIVALLTILFSMYILYVIPLQGRDAEIAHMDQVKEQFTGLKMDTDSLLVNKRVNYPIQRMIPLGTTGSGAGGSFSIIPMQGFSGSSGTLEVNTRDPGLGTVEIYLMGTAVSTMLDEGDARVEYSIDNIPLEPSDSSISIDPTHFLISYNVTSPPKYPNESETLAIYSPNKDNQNWSVSAQVIDRYEQGTVNEALLLSNPCDLTLSIKKKGRSTIDNLTIATNVSASGNPYIINLYDWTYGLADSLKGTYNFTYSVNGDPESTEFAIGQLAYTPIPDYIILPDNEFANSGNPAVTHPLSRFQYVSQNRYWLNQEYQYQWGAMFVNQSDGSSVLFTPPISIEYADNAIQVRLTDIILETYSPHVPDSSIGGSQNNPVLLTMNELTSSINGYTLLDGQTNANYVFLAIRCTNEQEAKKWEKTFTIIKNNAIRSNYGTLSNQDIAVTNITGENTAIFCVARDTDPPGFDLSAIVSGKATVGDVLTALNGSVNEEHLKIDYQRANISVSLYNLAL